MAWGRNIGRAAAHSAVALAGAVGSRSTSRSGACSAVGVGSTPFVRQAGQWAAGDDNPGLGSVTFSAATGGLDVLAGSTILLFVDDENFNGTPAGSGAPYPVTISDSQSGSYSTPGYIPDQYDLDSTEVFLRKNVGAGALTVSCQWTTNQWHGLTVCEIANVGTNPTVTLATNLNQPPSTATDSITTGTLALGSSPALLVAFGRNATDIAPTAGYPAAGTGFTQILTSVNWNGKESTSLFDSATLEALYLSSPGTVGATFTPRSFGTFPETFLALLVGIQP